MPSFQDILGGSLVQAVGGIIDKFHMSPEDKAKIQQAVEANQEAFQEKQDELEEKLNDIAGQNIRQDSSSGDAFVRRARPYFLWIIATAIGANIFIPLVNHCFGGHVAPVDVPNALYELFGIGYCGYSYLRTKEKIAGND